MRDEQDLEVPVIEADRRMAGKVAIVTGAGSSGALGGTGADIAILLAAKGASVVLLDRDEARARHTERAVGKIAGQCLVSVTDITDAASCKSSVDATMKAFGRIDVLVNNAAIAPGEQENSEELWDRIIDINLKGAKLMSDAVLPQMKAQGSGSIVHISSIAGFAAGGGIAYSAAKGGMMAMTRVQAHENGRSGVRVNTVVPGHVAIPMGLNFKGWDGAGSNAIRRKRARASLLGTEGTGWDIAYAVLFLASDESRYITAQTLTVDGGATAVMPIVMASVIDRE